MTEKNGKITVRNLPSKNYYSYTVGKAQAKKYHQNNIVC
jgi:hypothetical protein